MSLGSGLASTPPRTGEEFNKGVYQNAQSAGSSGWLSVVGVASRGSTTRVKGVVRRDPAYANTLLCARGQQCTGCRGNFLSGTTTSPATCKFDLPCGCAYCNECIAGLLQSFITTPERFPVACCSGKPFDDTLADVLLSGTNAERYRRTRMEALTPNKMYCPNQACSAFIDIDKCMRRADGGKYRCTCGTQVCLHCRAVWHSGMSCAAFMAQPTEQRLGAEDARALADARAKGCVACPNCNLMLDVASGCYHMRCRCTHTFCGKCGASWPDGAPTCPRGCAFWDENKLLQAPPIAPRTPATANASSSRVTAGSSSGSSSLGRMGAGLLRPAAALPAAGLGSSLGTFHLFIKQFDGKTLTQRVAPGHTVRMLKEAIEGDTGIVADAQRLVFGGKELQPEYTISHYGLTRDCTLHLLVRLRGGADTIQVFVKLFDGKTLRLVVHAGHSVRMLKEQIERDAGITAETQRLIFCGKELLDELPLQHYGIQRDCTLHLVVRLLGGGGLLGWIHLCPRECLPS